MGTNSASAKSRNSLIHVSFRSHGYSRRECLSTMITLFAGRGFGLLVWAHLITVFLLHESSMAQQPGTKLWEFQTGATVVSSPALGADGTIYIGTGNLDAINNGAFYSISPDGKTNWYFQPRSSVSASPAISQDGTVYVMCANGKLYALAADGTTNWVVNTGARCVSSPAIGVDGTLYVGVVVNTFSKLYAVRPDGRTNWVVTLGSQVISTPASVQFSSPAIGPDGTVYLGSLEGKVYAVSPAGRTNWVAALGAPTYSSPIIGPDGTIYIGADSSRVYAIDRFGRTKWTFSANGMVESSAAVSVDGSTIYIGSLGGYLYALTPSGLQRWVSNGPVSCSAAVCGDGSICYSTSSATFGVSSNHVVQWSFPLPAYGFSSPVVGADGTVYVAAGTKLYALFGTNGLADSSWPMFRRDRKHHARSVQCGLKTPQLLPDGNVVITLTIETGRTYQVQQGTNLRDWAEWVSFSSSSVATQLVDLTATNSACRFYRLWAP